MTLFEKMSQRYESGQVPWDQELPPPELILELERMPAGRMLDLGCGYGRAAIFAAKRGWRVDGIEFIPLAVEEARRRAELVGVAQQASFHCGSVADLDFLEPPFDFALDVGCMHALDGVELRKYRDGLARLLQPGKRYLLFARLRSEGNLADEGPSGIPEADIRALFQDGFHLEKLEYGETYVEENPPWKSAWFYFRRQ